MVRFFTVPTTSRPSWPTTSGHGPVRKLFVRNRHRFAERRGKVAEAGTEHDRHAGHIAHPRLNGFRRVVHFVVVGHAGRPGAHSRKPAIVAVMKLASVPANIARRPSRARSWRRPGASAPMPPIWMPMELKFAKPHKRKRADGERLRIERRLERTELRVGDELIERPCACRGDCRPSPRHATARPCSTRSARTPIRKSPACSGARGRESRSRARRARETRSASRRR